MFYLFVLFTLLSCTLAAPADVKLLNYELVAVAPTHVQVHEAALAKIGDVIESVPTAVSHQSSTIVHSKAQRVTPIVAPAVHSYTAPALISPLMHHASLFRAALPVGLSPAAAFVHAHAPLQLRSYAAPIYAGYAGYSYGSPLVYSAYRK